MNAGIKNEQSPEVTSDITDSALLIPYYRKITKEYTYLKKREDHIFLASFILMVAIGLYGAGGMIYSELLTKIFVVTALCFLCWGVLHFLQENAIFKGEVSNKIQEIEEHYRIIAIHTSNTVEFWKEDYYQLVLKLTTLGSALLVILR